MSRKDSYTLKEAAEILDLSTRSVRQKLLDGDLNGYKAKGKYGAQWFIPKSEIDIEVAVEEVIPMRKPISPSEFKTALREALRVSLEESLKEHKEEMKEELSEKFSKRIDKLEETIKTQNQQLEETLERQNDLLKEREHTITEYIRKQQEEPDESLWGRIKNKFSL